MADWFLPARGAAAAGRVVETLASTRVADTGGAVVVETRHLLRLTSSPGAPAGYQLLDTTWETTISPAGAGPDGPEAGVFALCDTSVEAWLAHDQAVAFAAAALRTTTRDGGAARLTASARDD